jgi:hypothetical protein
MLACRELTVAPLLVIVAVEVATAAAAANIGGSLGGGCEGTGGGCCWFSDDNELLDDGAGGADGSRTKWTGINWQVDEADELDEVVVDIELDCFDDDDGLVDGSAAAVLLLFSVFVVTIAVDLVVFSRCLSLSLLFGDLITFIILQLAFY